MKDYKKSYFGLIIWMISFLVIIFYVGFIPLKDENISILLIMNIMNISLAILTLMIYINEKIYWYNGIDYKKSAMKTSAERKLIALNHMKPFVKFAIIYLLYSIVAYILQINYWLHILVAAVGNIIAAFMTMKK